jgi:diguanylate cyclase (GGDEF)-like protein
VQEALRATGEEREELARLQAALAAAGDIAYRWDLTTDILRCSPGAGRALGIAALDGEYKGEAFERRLNPEDVPARRMALSSHLAVRDRYDCEYRVRGDDGEFCWVHDRGTAEFDPEGRPLRLTGMLRIVTTRKENQARLEYLTSYDELTGHYNRTRLREALEHALAYASRYGVSGGYCAIGIDRLSLLNEAFDYRTVNKVVVEVGRRLDRCLRASDVIGRLGDDSFGVVLAQCGESDLPSAAEKILEAVRAVPIETPNGPIHVTVSVGGVLFPDGARTSHEVMAKGELALQAARQGGRDSYTCYRRSDDDRRDHRRHIEIFEEVQAALKGDRLIFAYQPVVNAADHGVGYYECLLRMRRPDGELVAAGAFIPIVEQLGLIRAIDRRALELAVADLERNREVVLAVNVSSITAFDRSWFRTLSSLVKGHPELAERLIVEITETVAVPDVEEMARFVVALRELGCKVALDDFGAGYTSFRHLKSLTVDIVKIDGAFVRNVASNLDNQLFIRTLLGLAEGFGLGTVAECVETAEDAMLLAQHGVTYLQGWHFGKPIVDPAWRAAGNAGGAAGALRRVASQPA